MCDIYTRGVERRGRVKVRVLVDRARSSLLWEATKFFSVKVGAIRTSFYCLVILWTTTLSKSCWHRAMPWWPKKQNQKQKENQAGGQSQNPEPSPEPSPKPSPVLSPAPERWNGTVSGLKCAGQGISGAVFSLNDKAVVKIGFGSEHSTRDIETERKAYGILQKAKNRSPHILRCFELDNPHGLVLELCCETVRQRLRSIPEDAFPSDADARKWARQAAEGLAFIHKQDIIHADVGCHNMLLDSDDTLKLCDFGGSSVEGSTAHTKYEVWSRLPSNGKFKPTKMSDIFALDVSQNLYQRGQFPQVKKIVSLRNVIMNCWLQKYASASEIVLEIDPQRLLCCGTSG